MVAHVESKAAHTIPYIQEPPFVGSLFAFNQDRLALLLRLAQAGDVCGMHFGPFSAILFNRPEDVQTVLVERTSDFDKGRITSVLRPVLGNGILLSEGDTHRRRRKLIAPVFQPRQITGYGETMARYGEQIQQGWTDGATIDVWKQMTALTMSIVGKVFFDVDVLSEADTLGADITMMLAQVNHILSHLFAPPLSWPTPQNVRTRQAIRRLRERMKQLIDERRGSPAARDDLLSLLLQAKDEDGNRMSDEEVMEECLTLFVAGHETTATALTWAWSLLGQHPDAYQQVQQEVDSVLAGRTPTVADLARLPYCLQVLKEALRLYPPAYMVARAALRTIEIDGYKISKGTVVLLAPYTLHRKAEYFPEPEQFRPERFAPEQEKLLPRHAYLPFGAGPRICIGNHFALMEGHLLLATLAQRTTFTLVPGQTIQPDFGKTLVLRPGNAVKVVVKKR